MKMMDPKLPCANIRVHARRMKDILGLAAQTVGVKFIAAGAGAPENAEILERHRYCQALMLARRDTKFSSIPKVWPARRRPPLLDSESSPNP